MNTFEALLASLCVVSIGACASSHHDDPSAAPDLVTAPGLVVYGGGVAEQANSSTVVAGSAMERCLTGGGALREIDVVDNNDTTEHGEIRTFAVSQAGVLGVASADGTLKFWTLETFLGSASTTELGYGVEIPLAEATDLSWDGSALVSGDVRGAVISWDVDFIVPTPVGGAPPETSILAVAVDAARHRLAHSDVQAHGNVMVRGLESGEVVGPLETSLVRVAELGFMPDGRLLLAGSEGREAALELRAVGDALVDAHVRFTSMTSIDEVSIASNGAAIAAVGDGRLVALDATLAFSRDLTPPDHDVLAVAVTATGCHALTVGRDGTLRVISLDADEPGEIARLDVPHAMEVHLDATGDLALVAATDGLVRVFACEP